MNGPALDAWRFGMACVLGLPLGLCYSFLRPLRCRHPVMADLLFFPAMFYAWLYLGFAVCHGDIRLSYCTGLFAGFLLWELTLGKWLRPVFRWFWRGVFHILGGIFRIFEKFFKKIWKISKNVFALWKKWVTIVKTNRGSIRRKNGGVPIGKKESLF